MIIGVIAIVFVDMIPPVSARYPENSQSQSCRVGHNSGKKVEQLKTGSLKGGK